MKTNKFSIKVLAEVAIFAALALALDFLEAGYSRGLFFNGGSIGIAMVPIFIIGYRRGLVASLICGFLVSVLQMLGGIYVCPVAQYEGFMRTFVPFAQISLDYVLAYTLVGFCGAFSGLFKNSKTKGQRILWVVIGCVIGGLLKYTVHVLSGGFFYLNYGGSFLGVPDNTWFYTFFYNGVACIPSIILSTIIMVIVAAVYPQFLLYKNDDNIEQEEINDYSFKESEDLKDEKNL